VARSTLITLAILGITLTLHGMDQPPVPHDAAAVELGEATNPINPMGYCTDLIQQQVPFLQDAATISVWLQRERPVEFETLCQSSADDPMLTTRILRHVIAYEQTRSHHLARWRKLLAIYGGTITAGSIALAALLIKIGTSC